MYGAFLWLSSAQQDVDPCSVVVCTGNVGCGRIAFMPKQEKQMGQKKEEQDGELVCYSFTDQEQQRISGF